MDGSRGRDVPGSAENQRRDYRIAMAATTTAVFITKDNTWKIGKPQSIGLLDTKFNHIRKEIPHLKSYGIGDGIKRL